MAFQENFSRRTPLQMALERGLKPNGNLDDELRRLGEITIRSREDAQAICHALDHVVESHETIGVGANSALHALVALFQEVDADEDLAYELLAEEGIPRLIAIADEALAGSDRWSADEILFLLKIAAMYGTTEGTDLVLRAVDEAYQADQFLWSVILQVYASEHPERERLFATMAEALPAGFMGVSLLDAANQALIEGGEFPHPFDSTEGKRQLESLLVDGDPDHVSYAVSAAAALPFISPPERDALLALALDHLSPEIQIEAAWAAARLGREAGVKCLQRFCRDLHLSQRARRYLHELQRDDAVPADALEGEFQARAEFCEWLAHPNELGRSPEEVRVIDSRELSWPPEGDTKRMWLIEYQIRDTTGLEADEIGVGVVGSITFCLFYYKLQERSPEDALALHCAWELEARELVNYAEVDLESDEYDHLLKQWTGKALVEPRIAHVAVVSPELDYPQRMIALAVGRQGDEPGYLVADGQRSQWYPRADMPDGVPEATVLMLHLGRQLLGFAGTPDRRAYFRPPLAAHPPAATIAAYEALVEEARDDSTQRRKLFASSSILGRAFERYATALATARGLGADAATAEAFERLLEVARNSPADERPELYDSFSPLGAHFNDYVAALEALGHAEAIPQVIEEFRPHWQHNLGYATLGTAACKSGHDDLAETCFRELKASSPYWHRHLEMGALAEILARSGRRDESRRLLLEALRAILREAESATHTDRRALEEWFQGQRKAYLRIFPDRGANELAHADIPETLRLEE